MSRIDRKPYDDATPEMRAGWDDQIARYGRMTNMKQTLAHSFPAFRALMEWYPLRDAVERFLGPRATLLFAHAISAQTDCLICSTFFRRILIDGGENPDALALDPREQVVVDYARQLARDPSNVDDELYARLAAEVAPEDIVTLTTFGAIMVATNLFNNALRVDLDEYLYPYRRTDA